MRVVGLVEISPSRPSSVASSVPALLHHLSTPQILTNKLAEHGPFDRKNKKYAYTAGTRGIGQSRITGRSGGTWIPAPSQHIDGPL